jgi:phage-related tail protein
MGAVIHSRKLDELQRGVETALRNFTGNGADGHEPSDLAAMERINKIGNMSALAIVEASETTAEDIRAAAQAAVEVAADLMKEADQLATELRGNGQKISEHLREFAVLATKVSTAMRNTRSDVLNSAGDKAPGT